MIRRKHGFSAEPVPVSSYVRSSKNLKDLKDEGRIVQWNVSPNRTSYPRARARTKRPGKAGLCRAVHRAQGKRRKLVGDLGLGAGAKWTPKNEAHGLSTCGYRGEIDSRSCFNNFIVSDAFAKEKLLQALLQTFHTVEFEGSIGSDIRA